MVAGGTAVYLFQPKNGGAVHAMTLTQTSAMFLTATLLVRGLAAIPLTMTLYLSVAIRVIDQIEAQPNRDPMAA